VSRLASQQLLFSMVETGKSAASLLYEAFEYLWAPAKSR
jgi:hypothetical protein